MSANLVRSKLYWILEGTKLMGAIEFIKLNTGERTRIDIDGTVVKDQITPPKVEFCDRCEMFKSFEFGRYDFVMGSAELWYCMECK